MQNSKTRGILLGVGILGLSSITGWVQPAEAATNETKAVREARKDVLKAQKDVEKAQAKMRRADTRAERLKAQRELQQAQRTLTRERMQLRQEVVRANPTTANRPAANRRYSNYRPAANNAARVNRARTLEGVVVDNVRGNGFILQPSNGQRIFVQVQGAEPRRLNRNDVVRVQGSFRNTTFMAREISFVRDR
jgi:hypothetical protein